MAAEAQRRLLRPDMTAHAIGSLLLCAALSGCGGGGDSNAPFGGRFTVDGSEQKVTTSDTVWLHGNAFAPRGVTCTYFPGSQLLGVAPSCSCDVGDKAAGQWANAATGGTGALQLFILSNVTCTPPDAAYWSAVVALAHGDNPVSLSLSDGVTQGGATVTVTRN